VRGRSHKGLRRADQGRAAGWEIGIAEAKSGTKYDGIVKMAACPPRGELHQPLNMLK
jgi:hypothetical protein